MKIVKNPPMQTDDIIHVPAKLQSLSWVALTDPSYGDDVYLAYDEDNQIAYSIFDGWVSEYTWDESFESWIQSNIPVQQGELDVEDLGDDPEMYEVDEDDEDEEE